MHRKVFDGCRGQRTASAMGLLLAAAFALAPALAAAGETQTRKVKVADLDLAAPAGKQALDRRLRAAIDEVCSPRGSVTARPGMSRDAKACRQEAMASVRRQLEEHGLSPVLTADR